MVENEQVRIAVYKNWNKEENWIFKNFRSSWKKNETNENYRDCKLLQRSIFELRKRRKKKSLFTRKIGAFSRSSPILQAKDFLFYFSRFYFFSPVYVSAVIDYGDWQGRVESSKDYVTFNNSRNSLRLSQPFI